MLELSRYQAQRVELGRINFENKMFQYRVRITDEDVSGLAQSIKEHGQEAPIIVWERAETPGSSAGKELVIICGYRRFTAVRLLGASEILAVVIPEAELSYEQAVELSLDENIQRKSYAENDYLLICGRLSGEGKSVRKIAENIHISHGMAANYVAIAKLPMEIQEAIKAGKISIRNVLALAINQGKIQTSEAGVSNVGQGCSDEAVPNQISIENTCKLVEILKSPDYKKRLKELLKDAQGSYGSIYEIPGLIDKCKAIVAKRKDFAIEAVVGDGQIPENAPSGRLSFRQKAGVIDFNFSIDAGKDSLADLKRKAGFLKARAVEVERLAKELEKVKAGTKIKVKVKKNDNKPAAKPLKDIGMSQEELLAMGNIQNKMMENFLVNVQGTAGKAGINPFFSYGAEQLNDSIKGMQQALSMPGLSEADTAQLKQGIEKMQEALAAINKQISANQGS